LLPFEKEVPGVSEPEENLLYFKRTQVKDKEFPSEMSCPERQMWCQGE